MKENRGESHRTVSDHEASKQEMLKKFDANRDGKLSARENIALKKAVKKQQEQAKAEFLAKNDLDGDSKLSKEELKGAREEQKQELLNMFDTDNSGQLKGEERDKARNWLRENRPFIGILLSQKP